jgi:hypothetical protein
MLLENEAMKDLAENLISAPRSRVLQLLAAAINHFTVVSRAAYGRDDANRSMVEVNETIHRLSGHLRDLIDENEGLTASRIEAIVFGVQQLPRRTQAALEAGLVEPRRVQQLNP